MLTWTVIHHFTYRYPSAKRKLLLLPLLGQRKLFTLLEVQGEPHLEGMRN